MGPANPDQFRSRQKGAALLLALFLAALAAMTILVGRLTAVSQQSGRSETAGSGLIDAKDALLGYVLTNADPDGPGPSNPAPPVYWGVLPLPDLGKRNGSHTEGEALNNFGADSRQGVLLLGNKDYAVLLGRLPWKTLGVLPLRDHGGDCLWYGVSAAFKTSNSAQPNYVPTFNWDTLGDFETDLSDNLHLNRAVAAVFSPGRANNLQPREVNPDNQVAQCGGNYMLGQYLENLTLPIPATPATTDANQSVFYISAAQRSPAVSSPAAIKIATSHANTPSTDRWAGITTDEIFRQLAATGQPGTTLNALIPKIQGCLNDKGIPSADLSAKLAGANRRFSAPLQSGIVCPELAADEANELDRWRDNFWLLACDNPRSGCVTLKESSAAPPSACDGLLVFSGRRTKTDDEDAESPEEGIDQRRYTTANRNFKIEPEQYLEKSAGAGALGVFKRSSETTLTAPPLLSANAIDLARDVAVCLSRPAPSGVDPEKFIDVTPNIGGNTLVLRDTTTQTITLGNPKFVSGPLGASGCTWETLTVRMQDGSKVEAPRQFGTGYRFYFKVRIDQVGSGFTFALVDAKQNPDPSACGGAGRQGQFLGYAGQYTDVNGVPIGPSLQFPKIGIELDTVNNRNTSALTGRNDTTANHAAIVYWGRSHDWALPYLTEVDDDNVHDAPAGGQTGYIDPRALSRKTILELNGATPLVRTIHVRVDIERTYNTAGATGRYHTKVWTRPEKWGACTLIDTNQFNNCTGVPTQAGGFIGIYGGTITASSSTGVVLGSACSISFAKSNLTGKGALDISVVSGDAPSASIGAAQLDGDLADTVVIDTSTGQPLTSINAAPSFGQIGSTVRLVGRNSQSVVGHVISAAGQVTCSAALTTPAENAPPIDGMSNTTKDFALITDENPEMDEIVQFADPDTSEAFKSFRFGFTNAQSSSRRQKIVISDLVADPR